MARPNGLLLRRRLRKKFRQVKRKNLLIKGTSRANRRPRVGLFGSLKRRIAQRRARISLRGLARIQANKNRRPGFRVHRRQRRKKFRGGVA